MFDVVADLNTGLVSASASAAAAGSSSSASSASSASLAEVIRGVAERREGPLRQLPLATL